MSRGHDPEYSLVHAVGLCVLNWSRVETYLAELFHLVLQRPTPAQDSMLDRIPAFADRLAVIDAALAHAALGSDVVDRWVKLKAVIADKYSRRNAIVAAGMSAERIGARSSKLIKVHQVPVGAILKRDKSLHLSDLDAAANSFQRLAQDVADLHADVQSALISRFVAAGSRAAENNAG